jgi:hypothetical protein
MQVLKYLPSFLLGIIKSVPLISTGEEMESSHTYVCNENPASIEEEVLG